MAVTELYWDPFDRHLHQDPYDAWRRIRDEAPVYFNEKYGFYALSRYADVLRASLDTEALSSAHGITMDSIEPEPWPAPKPMIMMDPPEHTGLRKLVNRTFTPRRMAELEAHVHALSARYLDPFVGAGGFDFVQDFSMKLPVMVISSLLGFPEEDHDQLRVWSDAQLHRDEGNPHVTDAGKAAFEELVAYYSDQITRRRTRPTDDITSDIMAAELVEPDGTTRHLEDDEVLMFVFLINNAGNETVARLLGWAALTLARFPDQRAKLATRPDLIPAGIEELLRFEAPSPVQGRYANRAVAYHGVEIPAGAHVALLTGSAGRDEREYPDPDTYDVERPNLRHVSFGHGAHFCLGAALARMEAKVALDETLRRFPTWDVDHDGVTFVHTSTVRGPERCPIST